MELGQGRYERQRVVRHTGPVTRVNQDVSQFSSRRSVKAFAFACPLSLSFSSFRRCCGSAWRWSWLQHRSCRTFKHLCSASSRFHSSSLTRNLRRQAVHSRARCGTLCLKSSHNTMLPCSYPSGRGAAVGGEGC